MVHLGALPGSPLYDADGGIEALSKAPGRILPLCRRPVSTRSCSATRTTAPTSCRSTPHHPPHGPCHRRLAQRDHVPFGVNVCGTRWRRWLCRGDRRSFRARDFHGRLCVRHGVWAPDAGKAIRYRNSLGRSDLASCSISRPNLRVAWTRVARRPCPQHVFSSLPDAVLVSGQITGEAAKMEDWKRSRRCCRSRPCWPIPA